VRGSELLVAGALDFDQEDLEGAHVEDPLGDARAQGLGLDLATAELLPATDLGEIWMLLSFDGRDERPIPPPIAYSWPIAGDEGSNRWLGAGAPGTGSPPSTSWWQGICRTEAPATPQCDVPLPSYMITQTVTWRVPISGSGVEAGSNLRLGTANGAAISSFAWPTASVVGGPLAADTIPTFPAYRVPGEVELGIAPAGTPTSAVSFDESVTLDFEPSSPLTYSGLLDAPAPAGEYELHARSCWGLLDALVCVQDSTAFSI
jgi:hypothetical protein